MEAEVFLFAYAIANQIEWNWKMINMPNINNNAHFFLTLLGTSTTTQIITHNKKLSIFILLFAEFVEAIGS